MQIESDLDGRAPCTSTVTGYEDPLSQEQNMLQPPSHAKNSTLVAFTAQCVSGGVGREACESTNSPTVSSTVSRRFFGRLHMSPTGFVDGAALLNLVDLDSTWPRSRTRSLSISKSGDAALEASKQQLQCLRAFQVRRALRCIAFARSPASTKLIFNSRRASQARRDETTRQKGAALRAKENQRMPGLRFAG